MRQTDKIIEDILANGKAQGLTSKDIAVRAGIAPSNLSRIKKTGRFDADTLERLLFASNSYAQIIQNKKKNDGTLSFICQKLNAGRKIKISDQELHQLCTKFRKSSLSNKAFSHLIGLVEETPLEQVHNLILEGDATFPALKRICDFTEAKGPVAEWIYDRAAY